MRPALGLLLFADHSLEELVRLARLCEQLGYGSFWYTDVRFGRECYVGLSAVAAHTRRVRLGPGVSDPYTRHPAMTAAAIATLDELSGGRAMLGLGVGGHGFRELGIESDLRGDGPVPAVPAPYTARSEQEISRRDSRSPLHRGSSRRASGYHPRHFDPGDSVMFELLRSSSLRQLLSRQAPALVLSLVVAEMFYKFGSFTLECLGFLVTWFVLDALFALVARAFARPATDGA